MELFQLGNNVPYLPYKSIDTHTVVVRSSSKSIADNATV